LDIGYGGDPIKPTAITIDFALEREFCGDHPCNIVGDARKLPWFAAHSFDYVYSSHCLEDFAETRQVVREWLRVVKNGGFLVLLLPDQQKYERHCRDHHLKSNPDHKIVNFGPEYLRNVMKKVMEAKIILVKENLGAYNFLFIVKKVDWRDRMRDRLRGVPVLQKMKKALWPGKRPAPADRD
jgi:predicted SAM-dependent methyltransferase